MIITRFVDVDDDVDEEDEVVVEDDVDGKDVVDLKDDVVEEGKRIEAFPIYRPSYHDSKHPYSGSNWQASKCHECQIH